MKEIRHYIIAILLSVFVGIPYVNSQNPQSDRYFQYPMVPDNLETLGERTTYLVEHFWDFCNLKSAFSSKQKMAEAFNDYVSFMPYADSLAVFESIDRLIKNVKKTSDNNLYSLVQMAEASLYSDTAEYIIDAVYLPFARAATKIGKLPKEEKDKYSLQVSQLEATQLGMVAPDVTLVKPDGTTCSLGDLKGSYILILFDDPTDNANMMTRVRLSADYSLGELIKRGYVKVVSLYPGAPDENWKERVASYHENWIVVASPEAANVFDRRRTPTMYYLNKNEQILSKDLQIDNLLEAFRVVLTNQNRVKEERERLKKEAMKNRQDIDENNSSDGTTVAD